MLTSSSSQATKDCRVRLTPRNLQAQGHPRHPVRLQDRPHSSPPGGPPARSHRARVATDTIPALQTPQCCLSRVRIVYEQSAIWFRNFFIRINLRFTHHAPRQTKQKTAHLLTGSSGKSMAAQSVSLPAANKKKRSPLENLPPAAVERMDAGGGEARGARGLSPGQKSPRPPHAKNR
jgi:hypothetical protein